MKTACSLIVTQNRIPINPLTEKFSLDWTNNCKAVLKIEKTCLTIVTNTVIWNCAIELPKEDSYLKAIYNNNVGSFFNYHPSKTTHFDQSQVIKIIVDCVRFIYFNSFLLFILLWFSNLGQEKIQHTRRELDRLPLYYMDVDNQDNGIEYEFWEGFRQACLIPELSAFNQTAKLKDELVKLRNMALVIYGLINVLWIIFLLSFVQVNNFRDIQLLYGLIYIIQFLALLGHRFVTVVRLLARTPWKLGNN